MLAALARFDELERRLERALSIVSGNAVFTWTALELDVHGYADRARDMLGRSLAFLDARATEQSETRDMRFSRRQILYQLERHAEAEAAFARLVADFPG